MSFASFLNKVTTAIAPTGNDPQFTAKTFTTQAEMGVDANRPFNKNCFVMAHNAQASKAYGFVYFQQELSVTELLDRGVRGFNLDVRLENNQVFLVHGSFNETKAQMAGGTPPLAKDAFTQIAQWLAAHPTETVLILLESYVPNAESLPPILAESGLEPMIFYADGRNGGWNVEEKGWPTIAQMCEMGKRCVVLSGAKEDGMPYEYHYACEVGKSCCAPARSPRARPPGACSASNCLQTRDKLLRLFVGLLADSRFSVFGRTSLATSR
jgi:hypothetical protein